MNEWDCRADVDSYSDYPRAKGCNRPNWKATFGCMFCEWAGNPPWLPVLADDGNKVEYFMPYCPECVRKRDNYTEVIKPASRAKELYEAAKRRDAAAELVIALAQGRE